MKNPDYYKKIRSSAKRKNKSELEVYQSVSKCVDSILRESEEQDRILLLKSFVAYFEGMASNAWYASTMQITYALMIGAASILASLDSISEFVIIQVAFMLNAIAIIIGLFANNNSDFEKKMVICVLNDKLQEYAIEPEVDVNVTAIMVKDKKKKPKGKKKGKKKK